VLVEKKGADREGRGYGKELVEPLGLKGIRERGSEGGAG